MILAAGLFGCSHQKGRYVSDGQINRSIDDEAVKKDVIEIMEWKAIGAQRAGRHVEALAGFEAALAEADRAAPIASERLRKQIASALAASPRMAGSA